MVRPLVLLLLLAAGAACADDAPPAPRTMVLMRHGHYAPSPDADPKLGPGLTPLGVAQARLAGARLAGMPAPFDALLASPMTRAQETARVVASDLRGAAIETLPPIAECTPPTRRTLADPPEEMAACAKTLDAVFDARFKPARGAARRELWVCHGNVIRYLTTRALNVDPKAWLEMSIGNASLTTIRIAPDGTMQVIGVGDVGHLPPSLSTGSSADAEKSLAVPEK